MRNYGKPITEEIVREFLPLDLALYSVRMPGDVTTSVILSTRLDPIRTYYEIIEIDDVAEACTTYLIRMGAPVFRDARARRDYTNALEGQLRQGLAPTEARDAALRACGVQPEVEAPTE